MPIRRLPAVVASRIAAGARRVVVEIEAGGVELIRVADEGRGIEPAELPLALDRHAASELSSDDDLMRIETLAFRGEALPSIAAVADVDCVSRSASEPHAWRLRLRGGRAEPLEPAARAPGTTMTVRELFAELPARRKFLRGRASESGQVAGLLSNYVLAYPEIAFTLIADGRRTLEAPGGGDLLGAIQAVHGRAVAAKMLPVVPDAASHDGVVVSGCLGTGEATLPTRGGITLLVNRRWVQHRSLSYAL